MQTVLITGASGGIGREFAYLYAAKKYNLVLVGRSIERLNELSKNLFDAYNATVSVVAADLSDATSAKSIADALSDLKIDILINNAGVGEYGEFVGADALKYEKMLAINITALTILTRYFAQKMVAQGGGSILNVASSAAFQPIPKFAVYAASKAFVLHFSEALNYELRHKGVFVGVLCPGPTKTNFEKYAGASGSKLFRSGVMSARDVAVAGIKAIESKKMTTVVGCKNRFLAVMSTVNPLRKLKVAVANFAVNG